MRRKLERLKEAWQYRRFRLGQMTQGAGLRLAMLRRSFALRLEMLRQSVRAKKERIARTVEYTRFRIERFKHIWRLRFNRFKPQYDVIVVILALISVVMALADVLDTNLSHQPWFYPVDMAILILFAIDYVVRFYFARNKRYFMKTNVFELIAIIPFNHIFSIFKTLRIVRAVHLARMMRFARVTRITQVARLIGVGARLKARANEFLRMNGLIYIVYLNIASVLFGAVAIYLLERGTTVETFEDALWWAFVTSTTVGYGDISPSTGAGRIVAVILMLMGIGLVSMLTGTIATYFTIQNEKTSREKKIDTLHKLTSGMTEEELSSLIKQVKDYGKKDGGLLRRKKKDAAKRDTTKQNA